MDISFTLDLTSIDWLPTEADISGPYPRDIRSIDKHLGKALTSRF